jgi:hypothetical protein
MNEINPRVVEELRPLIRKLEKRGFQLVSTQYGGMSYLADFKFKDQTIRIVKDRGQWFVDGDKDKLEEFGLWRVHKSLGPFIKKLIAWIDRHSANKSL